MPRTATSRSAVAVPTLLLAAGSITFLVMGSRHPIIGATLGAEGSDAFFRAFAAEVLHHGNWQPIHAGILIGPVLWALAAAGCARLMGQKGSAYTDVGRSALLLAATLWVIAFLLDGFVAPTLARAIVENAGNDGVAIGAFRSSQLLMTRLGMVSIALIGTSIVTFSITLLLEVRQARPPLLLGALGVLVGCWPLFAVFSGIFSPGPFTSPWWTLTAISIGVWFAAFGATLAFLGRPDPVSHPSPAVG